MQRCTKCGSPVEGDRTPLYLNATCDLLPSEGYSGYCELKFRRGVIDTDTVEPDKSPRKGKGKSPARNKNKGKGKGK